MIIEGYVAIRKNLDEDTEWMDMNSFSYLIQGVRELVEMNEKGVKCWAKDNPVVRIAKVQIEEV